MLRAVCCTLAIATSWSLAAEYHVAVNGSDTNSGGASTPFQTLQKAASLALPGDVCIVHAGTYRETLKPARSGMQGNPITFMAAPGETVTLNGADLIPDWTVHAGKILKAAMAWDLGDGLNQVFAGDIMLNEARFPDPGPDPLHPVLAKVTLTGNSLSSADLSQPAGTWTGATFHGWVGESWTAQGGKITASSPGSAEIGGTKTTPWFQGVGKGYLTGTMAALDAPGEWICQAGALYLEPPTSASGAIDAGMAIQAKRRAWAIDLEGLSYIRVQGLNIFAASVRMTGDNCVVENMRAKYLSHFTHTGDGFYGLAQADQGRNGILIRGRGNDLRVCTLAYSAGCGVILAGTGNRVADCVIHAMDYQGLYSCPVFLEGNGNTLEWCTLYDAGRDLVHMTGTGHSLLHNELYNPGLLTQDLGAMYTNGIDGMGTVIAFNWVHDNHGKHGTSPCIYLDNKSRNFIVHHNVVWNCDGDAGIRINGPSQGHRIYNNTTFNADDVGTHVFFSEPGPNDFLQANNLLVKDAGRELLDTTARDFRLPAGSPAIDKGQPVPGITDGFKGTAPDLGAYEYGGEFWKAGARAQPGNTNTAGFKSGGMGGVAITAKFRNGELLINGENGSPAVLNLFNGQGKVLRMLRVRPGAYAAKRPPAMDTYFLEIRGRAFPIQFP